MSKEILDKIDLPGNPIFVVGYPRSGTTLVQSLLATQKHVYSLPETHFFNIINRKAIATDEQGFIEAECLDLIFAKIKEKMDLTFSRPEIKYIMKQAKKKNLRAKMLFEFIVYHYLPEEIKSISDSSYRWVEKTPNHAYFLDDIVSFYPQVQFINIIRHPVPAIYSRKINFPFNKDKPLDWLAKLWRRSVEETETFGRKHPGKIYTLKYEELAADINNEFKKICEFVNINLDPELMDNHSVSAGRLSLKKEVWKKKDEYRNIANTNDKYSQVVPREDAESIENILADKMEQYGYVSFFASGGPAGSQTFGKPLL
jgi:hypothetical protein